MATELTDPAYLLPPSRPPKTMNSPKIGKAYLVSAGPGRADLITVRGLKLLQMADVVLYDRLIPQELLTEIRPEAEAIYVGKLAHRHMMPQAEINALLVERVQAGKQVVRLKGGDAFVFGRGGEELLALAEAGLPFEVVPGVTSAIAAPAYAGIPVTHRGIATAFAAVTGYEDPTKPTIMTDWKRLAYLHTLVMIMAVKHIQAICQALIEAGRSPDTPAAAISSATTDQQQVVRATLDSLAKSMADRGLVSPAVIVIGEVVALHDKLAWFQADGEAPGFIPVADHQRTYENSSKSSVEPVETDSTSSSS